MKKIRKFHWYLFSAAILIVPLFMLVTAPYALGCIPDDAGGCAKLPKSPTAVAIAARADPPTVPTPTGNDPATARIPLYVRPDNCIDAMCPQQSQAASLTSPLNWTWIAPNSSTWYRVNDGHGLQIQFWLFANGQQGLSFDVFAPDQKDFSKPIGRGSFNKSQANIGADLFYSGRTWASGEWYFRINNGTSYPISYSVRFTLTIPTLGGNVCDSCHKLIGYDWAGCSGTNFCQNLHQLYDTNPTCYNHDVTADLSGGCQ